MNPHSPARREEPVFGDASAVTDYRMTRRAAISTALAGAGGAAAFVHSVTSAADSPNPDPERGRSRYFLLYL